MTKEKKKQKKPAWGGGDGGPRTNTRALFSPQSPSNVVVGEEGVYAGDLLLLVPAPFRRA